MQHPRKKDVVGELRLPRHLRRRVHLGVGPPDDPGLALRLRLRFRSGSPCRSRAVPALRPARLPVGTCHREKSALIEIRSVQRLLRRRGGRFAAHPGGGELDRFEDLDVAGAAAEIAGERFLDLLAARLRVVLQERPGGQEKSGRAISALRGAQVREGLLEWMEPARVRHPLDGLDFSPFAFEPEVEAGEDRLAVHQHRAGPALAELAAMLGSRQPQVLAKHLEQRLVRRERGFCSFSVQQERDPGETGRILFLSAGSGHGRINLIPLF